MIKSDISIVRQDYLLSLGSSIYNIYNSGITTRPLQFILKKTYINTNFWNDFHILLVSGTLITRK